MNDPTRNPPAPIPAFLTDASIRALVLRAKAGRMMKQDLQVLIRLRAEHFQKTDPTMTDTDMMWLLERWAVIVHEVYG